MPALTKTQLEHAKQRLTEARKKYVAAKIAELGPEPEQVELSNAEKFSRIKAGAAKLKSDVYWRCNVVEAFDFDLTYEERLQQDLYDTWKAKCKEIDCKAEVIERNMLDELVMNPNGIEALKRISEAFRD